MSSKREVDLAKKLMDDFASRSGLEGESGLLGRRYLWTDALAVEAFLNLSKALGEQRYKKTALKLVEAVHHVLGRHHPKDSRKGWISALSEDEAKKFSMAKGLRIGKPLPERSLEEPFDQRLEWDREGQYFHYLTRWIDALLLMGKETNQLHYDVWAARLCKAAAEGFIEKKAGQIRMFWKMSVDLSRPLVHSMGAHDPLEGYLCCQSALLAAPEYQDSLRPAIEDFEKLCQGMDWFTTDPLGIGGLLANLAKAKELAKLGIKLSPATTPEKLLSDVLASLKAFMRLNPLAKPAGQRLAFRDCGLSRGLRLVSDEKLLSPYETLAPAIESFWLDPERQKGPGWTQRLDINSVTLASSILASCDFKSVKAEDHRHFM